jgi:CheY-like chemotaxis protein
MLLDINDERPVILAVDDSVENLQMLASLLKDDYRVKIAKSGQKAIELAGQYPFPDLVLMDVMMPEMNGFEACEKLKGDARTQKIPIIFLTALNEVADETTGLQKGGADFISKPINPDIVKARINVHLALQAERKKTETLLKVLLPDVVISDLIKNGSHKPEIHKNVSILFCDFIDFTGITSQLTPEVLIAELTDIYGHFDEICEKYGATRIKTIGDAYMAATGLNSTSADHAKKLVNVGFDFIAYLNDRNKEAQQKWRCRIGVHSGSVIAGIIGKTRFVYDIIGVDVNIASRVESVGRNMAVTITEATRRLLDDNYVFQSIGETHLKGAGDMELFIVEKRTLF